MAQKEIIENHLLQIKAHLVALIVYGVFLSFVIFDDISNGEKVFISFIFTIMFVSFELFSFNYKIVIKNNKTLIISFGVLKNVFTIDSIYGMKIVEFETVKNKATVLGRRSMYGIRNVSGLYFIDNNGRYFVNCDKYNELQDKLNSYGAKKA